MLPSAGGFQGPHQCLAGRQAGCQRASARPGRGSAAGCAGTAPPPGSPPSPARAGADASHTPHFLKLREPPLSMHLLTCEHLSCRARRILAGCGSTHACYHYMGTLQQLANDREVVIRHRTTHGSTWSMPAMSLKVVRVFPRPSSSRCAPPKILPCTGASCHDNHDLCQVVPPLCRCRSHKTDAAQKGAHTRCLQAHGSSGPGMHALTLRAACLRPSHNPALAKVGACTVRFC